MEEGHALANQWIAYPDFPGDRAVPASEARPGQTVSESGPAELIPAWKCPRCGRSLRR